MNETENKLNAQINAIMSGFKVARPVYDNAHNVLESDRSEFIEDNREFFVENGLSVDPEDWDADEIHRTACEALDDVLAVSLEPGEPFAVTFSLGGPNVYGVDFGKFGGFVLLGYWGGDEVRRTGEDVDEMMEYYRDLFSQEY